MKKIIALVFAVLSLVSAKSQQIYCLRAPLSQNGNLVKFIWNKPTTESQAAMISDWHMLTIRLVSNQYNWNSMTEPPQTVRVLRDVTAMTTKGVMLKSYGENWVEYGGAFINPLNSSAYVMSEEYQWAKCGYFANVHILVKVYTTLPPVGRLIDQGQAWLN